MGPPALSLQRLGLFVVSKRFKGLVCAYCPCPSVTGDHVFAKEFFLKTHRADLPQVPVCDQCNRAKSQLEHYLTTVLPFFGRHEDALPNLSDMVPPRLAKNAKLHRTLSRKASKVWTETTSGLQVRSTTLPFEPERLIRLFTYIVRGLLLYHWNVKLTDQAFVEVVLLDETRRGNIFAQILQHNANARVSNNLGNGTFTYDGAQGIDNYIISVWRFSIYGNLQIGALTGPKRVAERTELYAKMGCWESPSPSIDLSTGFWL
jgi:hypothetical protein